MRRSLFALALGGIVAVSALGAATPASAQVVVAQAPAYYGGYYRGYYRPYRYRPYRPPVVYYPPPPPPAYYYPPPAYYYPPTVGFGVTLGAR
jgi:hypothetical protein